MGPKLDSARAVGAARRAIDRVVRQRRDTGVGGTRFLQTNKLKMMVMKVIVQEEGPRSGALAYLTKLAGFPRIESADAS